MSVTNNSDYMNVHKSESPPHHLPPNPLFRNKHPHAWYMSSQTCSYLCHLTHTHSHRHTRPQTPSLSMCMYRGTADTFRCQPVSCCALFMGLVFCCVALHITQHSPPLKDAWAFPIFHVLHSKLYRNTDSFKWDKWHVLLK